MSETHFIPPAPVLVTPPPIGLTPRQMHCLQVIIELMDARGVSPSIGELCVEMDMKSRSAMHGLIAGLIERGWIRTLPYKARSITVLHRPPPLDFSTPDLTLTRKGKQTAGGAGEARP